MSDGRRRRRPSRGAKMNLERARAMRAMRARGAKLISLAFEFQCSEALASRICRGLIWPEPEAA